MNKVLQDESMKLCPGLKYSNENVSFFTSFFDLLLKILIIPFSHPFWIVLRQGEGEKDLRPFVYNQSNIIKHCIIICSYHGSYWGTYRLAWVLRSHTLVSYNQMHALLYYCKLNIAFINAGQSCVDKTRVIVAVI